MHMPDNWMFWLGFIVFVLAMLALDLGVFNRKAHKVEFKEALTWTAVWISLAAVFAVLVYFFGHTMTGHMNRPNRTLALEFVTGYLIEESLSIDNLFVFLLIFRFFKVHSEYQHKVLFWGIMGALVMRAIFIFAGVSLINRFHWIIYVFGAFLIYVGFGLLKGTENAIDPGNNMAVRLARKYLPLTEEYEGGKFVIQRAGKKLGTPLLLVLIVVEFTDLVFAIDSIPAVLAITREPFIVFTSNVFAIMGLRSLYFALAGMIEIFHLLHYGLAVILMFIGAKMLGSHYFEVPIGVALGVVVGVLVISVVASLMFPKKHEPAEEPANG